MPSSSLLCKRKSPAGWFIRQGVLIRAHKVLCRPYSVMARSGSSAMLRLVTS